MISEVLRGLQGWCGVTPAHLCLFILFVHDSPFELCLLSLFFSFFFFSLVFSYRTFAFST